MSSSNVSSCWVRSNLALSKSKSSLCSSSALKLACNTVSNTKVIEVVRLTTRAWRKLTSHSAFRDQRSSFPATNPFMGDLEVLFKG